VKLVPFNRRFTDEEKDPHLRLALIDEAPGILAWAVEGARKWYEQGLGDCEAVKAATSDYRKDSDLVGRFLEERCEQRDGEQIQAKKLYEVFELWAKEQGITQVMTREALSKRLREKGFANVQRTGGKFFWQGLTVQRSEDEDNLPNLGW
jgi:putative DNA primase/helicase